MKKSKHQSCSPRNFQELSCWTFFDSEPSWKGFELISNSGLRKTRIWKVFPNPVVKIGRPPPFGRPSCRTSDSRRISGPKIGALLTFPEKKCWTSHICRTSELSSEALWLALQQHTVSAVTFSYELGFKRFKYQNRPVRRAEAYPCRIFFQLMMSWRPIWKNSTLNARILSLST